MNLGKQNAISIILLLNFLVIAGILAWGSNSTVILDLRNILSPDSCYSSCWAGIEPQITNRAEVEHMLAQQGIEYEIGMLAVADDSFTWHLNDVNPLLDRDHQIDVMIEFSGDVVARVFLLSVNICISDAVSDYGIPLVVSQSSGPGDNNYIELYYPDKGLIFFIRSEGVPYIGTVYITSTEFVNYFVNSANSVGWESVKNDFTEDCS